MVHAGLRGYAEYSGAARETRRAVVMPAARTMVIFHFRLSIFCASLNLPLLPRFRCRPASPPATRPS